jgi:hypothetical protein
MTVLYGGAVSNTNNNHNHNSNNNHDKNAITTAVKAAVSLSILTRTNVLKAANGFH